MDRFKNKSKENCLEMRCRGNRAMQENDRVKVL